jgi:CHAD domain-containing protein
MKQRTIISMLKKRCRNLHRHYQDLLEDFAVEAIHDFRLEVKKLRAFLRMLNACATSKGNLRITKELRAFYGAVGEVRCLQLQEELVNQFCKEAGYAAPVHYLSALLGMESEAKVKVREAAMLFQAEIYHRRLLKAAKGRKFTGVADSFAAEKTKELVGCLSAVSLQDEDLHGVRKILKDLLYVWYWIAPFLSGAMEGQVLTRQYFVTLTEKLGDFQDMCTALTLLAPAYCGPVTGLREKKVLDAFAQYCTERKEALREAIIVFLCRLRNEPMGTEIFRTGKAAV